MISPVILCSKFLRLSRKIFAQGINYQELAPAARIWIVCRKARTHRQLWSISMNSSRSKVGRGYFFFHRVAAAFLAIALRRAADSFFARALPPLEAPSLERATAA